MLYFNGLIAQDKNEYVINFNGNGQHLRTQGGTPFVQWERTQPWTFFCSIKVTKAGINQIFDQRNGVTGIGNKGIAINSSNNKIQFGFVYGDEVNLLLLETQSSVPSNTFFSFMITYNGNSSAVGFNVYFENTIQPLNTLFNNPASSIINPDNMFVVGKNFFAPAFDLGGQINHLSFVNYVKTQAERTADFNNKKQSIGTGSWLLAPIEPIYKDNLSTQIKSLTTASINAPLPNPLALVNAQGYKLNAVGYPTTLVKGVNLIKL